MTTRNNVLNNILDGVSPEVAFALGKAQRYMEANDACARLLEAEGLADEHGGSSYARTNRLADILTEAFEDRSHQGDVPGDAERAGAGARAARGSDVHAGARAGALHATGGGAPPLHGVRRAQVRAGQSRCSDCTPLAIDVKPPGIEF